MITQMRKISLTLVLAGLFSYACNFIVECDECFTPPPSITIALIDAQTGENLFAQYRVLTSDVEIYYLEGQTKKNIELTFIPWGWQGDTIISADELSWKSVSVNRFYMSLGNGDTDTIDIKTNPMKDDCCTYFRRDYFEFNDTPVKDSTLVRPDNYWMPANVFFKM
jgi:hypothetical protein